MAVNRITRKVLHYIEDKKLKLKQKYFSQYLIKEVNIGANGTQKYVIKEGRNKGKVLDNA